MADTTYEVKIRVHSDTLEKAMKARIAGFKKEMLSDAVRLEAAILYADAVKHLVPMSDESSGHSGTLRNLISFPKYNGTRGVQYNAPYARAQYRGYTRGPVLHWTTDGTRDHWNHYLSNRDRSKYYDDVKQMIIERIKNGQK